MYVYQYSAHTNNTLETYISAMVSVKFKYKLCGYY